MMEKVLLSILAASVLCVVSSHVQHQYHFVYEVKNMTEAQSYCRDKYTDLATIDDMEDVKTLTDMMDLNKMVLDEYGQATVWIGLYHDMDSLRWSDRHAEVEFTNWAKGEPNNDGSGEHCTEMSDTGEWNDADCALTRQAVCSSVRGSNVTFILILRPMSWTEAQSYCRANYTDLATVRNEAENQEVKNLTDGEEVWIGLFRDSWKWSDGSNSSFRYWASGEPHNNVGKEDCVAVNFNHSGGWEDWNCGYNKPFICSKVLTAPTTEEPNWTSQPFPTSVPSASTTATTQSSISSSGSFTPSSSFPETTEQSAVLSVVSSHVQHQYHFVYEVKNMKEAQSYCRDKYTDLATIDDMEDVKTLTDMVDLNKMVHGSATVWIGLYHDMDSWRWSDRHAKVEFTNWAKDQPDNHGSGEHCTMMYDTGEWKDADCAQPLQAVCSYVRGSDVKFILINSTMTWTEAQSYCRANYTDLVTVRNEAENQEVKNLTDGENVWIGFFRDSWKWSDGSNSSFTYWKPGEPNNNVGKEDCVAVNFDHSGGWEDWNCGYNKPFICSKVFTDPTTEVPNWTLQPFPTSVPSASTTATTQSSISSSGSFTPSSSFPETTEQFAEIDPKHKMRVSVKMNSALDLNNPEVMEEVLKQLKQRLKEKGVNEDVKLSWKKQPDGKVFHKEKKKTSKKDEL